MGQTIHQKKIQDAAMAELAKVHDARSDSAQVPGLFMVANARPKDAGDFPESGSYWTCAFYMAHSTATPPELVTRYSMGAGLGYDPKAWHYWAIKVQPPTCDDVLGCLCMDAQGYDDARDFEDWAEGYGMDTDSRKAERDYRTIGEQAKALRRMLGKDYADVIARGAREWSAEP